MSHVGQAPDVVVQIEDHSDVVCDSYYDVPLKERAYIALLTDGSPIAEQEARLLRRELQRQIVTSPSMRVATSRGPCVTCPGNRVDFDCAAINRHTSRNVFVVLGGGGVAVSSHPRVVVPPKSRPRVLVLHHPGTVTPKVPWGSATTNTASWHRHATEFVPEILAAAGLTDPEARVFISYRRQEAGELAEQLFEALAKRNVDVFVDRFRIEVGADFRQRILQELAHKSMVVYLESAGIMQSKWTRYEIAVAKSARLGVLALELANGTPIPAIDNSRRLSISSKGKKLPDAELATVVERIVTDHSSSLMRRRRLMRENMQRALRRVAVFGQRVEEGAIVVEPTPTSSKRYVVWLPSRPAELRDFHIAATVKVSSSVTLVRSVVAPVAHLVGEEHERMRWLSEVCGVRSFNESHMLQVAEAMQQEQL